jgi:hypothetical protein
MLNQMADDFVDDESRKILKEVEINHQQDATISPVYYPDVYLQLNMFRESSRPSSRAQQLQLQLFAVVELLMMGVRTPET